MDGWIDGWMDAYHQFPYSLLRIKERGAVHSGFKQIICRLTQCVHNELHLEKDMI